MVRAFTPEPIAPELIDRLCDRARRVPSAGNTQAVSFGVLEGPATARLWDVTLPPERRAGFRWQGLLAAPVLMLVLVDPAAYVERYAEDDKARPGLGESLDGWPVPFWWVDAGMAVQQLLVGIQAEGLGACFFGLFEHEAAVLAALGAPAGRRAVGVVACGHPAPDEPGRSSTRARPPLDSVVWRPAAYDPGP